MKWLTFMALILFTITPAPAAGLADNPAFCFGFISAQSRQVTDAQRLSKPHIRSLFAKFGPKDSTDERGFDDWEKIGRDIASNQADKRHAIFLENCRRLLRIN